MFDPEDDGSADEDPFDIASRFEEPPEPGAADLGPSVPQAPEPPSADEVPTRVRRLFWMQVVVFKFAVLGAGVGGLMVLFDTHATIGLQVLAASLLLFLYGFYRTRRAKREVTSILEDDSETTTGEGRSGEPDPD